MRSKNAEPMEELIDKVCRQEFGNEHPNAIDLYCHMEDGNEEMVAEWLEGFFARHILEYLGESLEREFSYIASRVYDSMIVGTFCCLEISYYESLSYEDLMQEMFPDLSKDRETRKKLANSFKECMRKIDSQGEEQIAQYRRNHSSVGDANQGKGLLYKPIPRYRKCGYQFEVWMQARKRTTNYDIEVIQKKALEKLADIIPDLTKDRLAILQQKYSKLRVMDIEEMTFKQLQDYISIINYKKAYIRKYSEPELEIQELLSLEKELNLLSIYDRWFYVEIGKTEPITFEYLLTALAYALHNITTCRYETVEEMEKDEKNHVFWRGMLSLAYRLSKDGFLDEKRVNYSADEIWQIVSNGDFPEHTGINREMPELLEKRFIRPLEKENDDELLKKYIWIGILIYGGNIDESGLMKLTRVVQILFTYQQEHLNCLKDEEKADGLAIKKCKEETERRLEKIGLNCSLEKYETPFQKEYYQFFKKCNEKRFILLYMAIKRTIETDKVVDQNTLVRFVNIYYASINRSYVRRQGHEEEHMNVKMRNRDTAKFLYNELIKFFFPSLQKDAAGRRQYYTNRKIISELLEDILDTENLFFP